MRTRALTLLDLQTYIIDIYQCYKDNPQILDAQSPYFIDTPQQVQELLIPYIEVNDSMIRGIFDDKEQYLYGIVLFDIMRVTPDGSSCEIHIATAKPIWGKILIDTYKQMLNEVIFDSMYCMIPANCVLAIRIAKAIGFKKTGYIPKAIPYVNSKKQIKMYDLQIYSLQKGKL